MRDDHDVGSASKLIRARARKAKIKVYTSAERYAGGSRLDIYVPDPEKVDTVRAWLEECYALYHPGDPMTDLPTSHNFWPGLYIGTKTGNRYSVWRVDPIWLRSNNPQGQLPSVAARIVEATTDEDKDFWAGVHCYLMEKAYGDETPQGCAG